MTELEELKQRHEMLRREYETSQNQLYVYMAACRIDLDSIEARRRELAEWAAAEAERWLDFRAGNGPNDQYGKNLREIAGLLVIPTSS